LNRLFRWGIFIALLVLLACGFIAIKMVFDGGEGVVSPSLVGMSTVEATNELQQNGLLARIDQVDSNSPEGTVIAQSIPAGTKTDKGKIVTLKVSRGGARVNVPDVRDEDFQVAVQRLSAAGLKVGAIIRVSDQLKQPNIVIAQNPASPAWVMSNRMVDLLVSEGGSGRAETVQVPDVRGETEEHARQILEQSLLSVSKVNTQATNQFPEGTVVKIDPKQGARVQTGRAVTLTIASIPDAANAQQNAPRPQSPTPNPQPRRVEEPPQYNPYDQNTTGGGQAKEIGTWNPGGQAQPQPQKPPQPQPPASQPKPPVQPKPAPPAVAGKVAKVRYQVPPLARPLSLNIVMSDQAGTRVLRNEQVRGGEYVSMDTPYSGSATVTVRLGDKQVWQERYN
jgi:serine/threonine-protein kinase